MSADEIHCNLLYGEVLPSGVERMLVRGSAAAELYIITGCLLMTVQGPGLSLLL